MKAYVFPGQGSQFTGMDKDLYDQFDIDRNLFHEADSILGFSISKEMFEGSEESLKQTKVTETKFGMNETELRTMLESSLMQSLKNVRIRGLMGMATNTPDMKQVATEFRSLRKLYDQLKTEFSGHTLLQIDTLSMGMSGDYELAVRNGSNMVRIGSLLFGGRL